MKYTDDEVIKALECCLNGNVNKSQVEVCSPCPFFHDGNCTDFLKQNALALINRQKASLQEVITLNSKLEAENAKLQRLLDFYEETSGNKKAKAEAIKEFAENVKAIFECVLYFDDDVKECILNEIDELVKEMTEENNESKST